jgi:glyoxylase-like metal-dependent hydrolase (beta-lactamase superfamily II)
MRLEQVAPGIRRWTAFHPEWKEEVACHAVETAAGLVLVDPLDPPPELPRPDHVLLTVYWHARSTRGLRARRVWAPVRSAKPLERRGIRVTDPVRAGDTLVAGIEAFPSGRASELVYLLPGARALVAGDVLLGGPLRICPDSWVGKGGQAAVRDALAPLLERRIERVLVSHGDPVLRRGRAALERALRQAPSAA